MQVTGSWLCYQAAERKAKTQEGTRDARDANNRTFTPFSAHCKGSHLMHFIVSAVAIALPGRRRHIWSFQLIPFAAEAYMAENSDKRPGEADRNDIRIFRLLPFYLLFFLVFTLHYSRSRSNQCPRARARKPEHACQGILLPAKAPITKIVNRHSRSQPTSAGSLASHIEKNITLPNQYQRGSPQPQPPLLPHFSPP